MRKMTFGLFFVPLTLFISSCSSNELDAVQERRATAKPAHLRDVLSRTGLVQPVVNVDLQSESSGRIEKVTVNEGQEISRGDTIIVIDPSRLRTQREKMSLSLRRAQLEKQRALRDYENATQLTSTGSVSQRKLQDFKITYDLAEINYQQQRLELRDINEQLEKTVVTSPLGGVITSLLVKEGEIAVSAVSGFQSGTAIGTIADIRQLEVVTSIGEVDYVHLKKGQQVNIRPETSEGAQTRGSIRFISLSAQRRNSDELGSFEVRATIDSIIPGIAPGINVNVEFVILDKKVEVAVPYHFVRTVRGKDMVTVARKDSDGNEYTEEVEVTTGATDYIHYEILSGISAGEVIVFRHDQSAPGRAAGGGMGRRR